MRLPLRGEVWAVDLNPARGHEHAGRRPCLVISDDIYNQGPAAKNIVLPVTSRHKGIPYHLTVKPPEGGLQLASYIMCDDVRSALRSVWVLCRAILCVRSKRTWRCCLAFDI